MKGTFYTKVQCDRLTKACRNSRVGRGKFRGILCLSPGGSVRISAHDSRGKYSKSAWILFRLLMGKFRAVHYMSKRLTAIFSKDLCALEYSPQEYFNDFLYIKQVPARSLAKITYGTSVTIGSTRFLNKGNAWE